MFQFSLGGFTQWLIFLFQSHVLLRCALALQAILRALRPPWIHGRYPKITGRFRSVKISTKFTIHPSSGYIPQWEYPISGEYPMYIYLLGGLEHFGFCFHMLGISSAQLTNSYFSEGSSTNETRFNRIDRTLFREMSIKPGGFYYQCQYFTC